MLEGRITLTANAVGTEQLVNDVIIGDQFVQTEGAIAASGSGQHVTVYAGRGSGDQDGVFFRLLDSEGVPTGTSQLVNETVAGIQANASVAMLPESGFVIVWQGRGAGDREGIFARWYDSSGNPVTGEVLINQTTGGGQENPAVAVASDGSASFVWQGVGVGDFDGIFYRRFDSNGQSLTGEILVNTTTSQEQALPDIAINSSDVALVTWSSRHQDGSDWGVYAQRLSANGSKIGIEFLVNSSTVASQSGATVIDSGQAFTVAWQSRNQDGDGWGIFAQQIDPSDGLVGQELQVNSISTGNQLEVALAQIDGGQLVATWTNGIADGTGWNVKATVVDFSDSNVNPSDEFFVNANTANDQFGHQRTPSAVAVDNAIAITWGGDGPVDHDGTYLACFLFDEVNIAPDITPIPEQTATVGEEMIVEVTAFDENDGDILTYILDPENSPSGATIEKVNNNMAIIRWTPTADFAGQSVTFGVLVIDDGEPPLADSEEFTVTVGGTS
ncbi:hypothetical protein C5Y96_22915 [Blastopirellula marina]|uniref:Cadherin domain-containing protein n=1 Tax=Blastopirellula marina TaxID=124 RepID=A0A2S8F0H7_9BACT|nr:MULTISPECIES: hypothetical protein [Pirellulaceae]PQO25675.1 hypothetical protein C5Y96_22915 [Blastopirellula marina]RCS43358.1 hypothetical protein DTL36_22965 [Bremerella cremea]